MKIRYYTDKELELLNKNMFVKEVHLKRTIEYDVVFKLWCIMMRLEFPELTGKDIFLKAGFDVDMLHNNLPYRRIADWVKNYKKFGLNYFLPDLEPYHSLDVKNVKKDDLFKTRLLSFILIRLKELDSNEKG